MDKRQLVEYKSVICFKGTGTTQVDEKCDFSSFSIISISEAPLRIVLTISTLCILILRHLGPC